MTRRREALSAQPASTLTAGGTFTAAGGGNGPRSDRNSRPHLRKTPEHILRTNYVAGTKIESDLGKIKQEKKSHGSGRRDREHHRGFSVRTVPTLK